MGMLSLCSLLFFPLYSFLYLSIYCYVNGIVYTKYSIVFASTMFSRGSLVPYMVVSFGILFSLVPFLESENWAKMHTCNMLKKFVSQLFRNNLMRGDPRSYSICMTAHRLG